jgi:23S rRNA (uracil1939-C5)-methyltransferase
MQLKKGEIKNVTIEKLAFGGEGIGHIDLNGSKYVVFVEDGIPGDKVEAVLIKIKKNFAKAKINKIIKKSELRTDPRCRHFEYCGGCTLQNIPYKKQLEIKQSQVTEALEHLGGFESPVVETIIKCENIWYYRNKMEFSFRADVEEGLKVGLHPRHHRYHVFQVEECFLENDDIGSLLQKVREFAADNNLSVYNFNKNEGLLRCIIIREGKRTKKRMINLLISHEDFGHEKGFIELLTSSKHFKPADSIYITRQTTQKGKRTEFSENHIYGDKFLLEKMLLENGTSLDFEIPPSAFFQPNTLQAEKLYSTVIEAGEISKNDTVYDLFCGTGTIGLFCAHKAKEVIGVDINEQAVLNAKKNAGENNIKNAEFHVGDTYKIIKDFSHKPDKVIVDPPRSGLGDKLCGHLIDIKAPVIVYVSCNPATLARDLSILCGNTYKLEFVQPVDMFPHTYHIETVSRLVLQK